MSKRLLDGSWLDHFVSVGKFWKASEVYLRWVGLAVLAASLRRQIFLKRGPYTLYPNVYIILVGDSSTGKSTVADWGYDEIAANVPNVNTFDGSITTERLIERLSELGISENSETMLSPNSTLFLYSTELSTLLKTQYKNSASLLDFLTKIYSRSTHIKSTAKDGDKMLENICINLLGCTTPEGIQEIFGRTAIEGGFASRIIFVFQEGCFKTPWPDEIPGYEELKSKLIWDLTTISKLNGIASVDKDAKEWYSEWFYKYLEKSFPYELKHYKGRGTDHLLKISLLLSVAEDDSLRISLQHMLKAKKYLEEVENLMPLVFKNVSKTRYSELRDITVQFIKSKGGLVTREQLCKRLNYRINNIQELDNLIFYLEDCNIIRTDTHYGKFKSRKEYVLICDKS